MFVSAAFAQSGSPGAACPVGYPGALGAISQLLNSPFGLFILVLSVAIIILFASDRYAKPTYSSDQEGLIGQIAPRFLTSDSRYITGLQVYIGIILTTFFLLTIVGSTAGPILFSATASLTSMDGIVAATRQCESQVPAEVYPLVIALALVGLGSATDNSLLGQIEFRVRRFAHERAFIPQGTRMLSLRLASDKVGTWQLPVFGGAASQIKALLFYDQLDKANGDLGPIRSIVQELSSLIDDFIIYNHNNLQPIGKNFVSDKDIGARLYEKLKKIRIKIDSYSALKAYYSLARLDLALKLIRSQSMIPGDFERENLARFDNIRASIDAMRIKIADAISTASSPEDLMDRLDPLLGDIRRLRLDASVLLAGGLLRSRPNDDQVSAALNEIGFEDDGIPLRRNWFGFLNLTVLLLVMGAIISYFLVTSVLGLAIKYTTLLTTNGMNRIADDLPFSLFGAVVGYLLVLTLSLARREQLLRLGEWREFPFHRARLALFAGFVAPVGVMLLNLILVPEKPRLEWFISTGVSPLLLCLLAAFFLNRHLERAGRDRLDIERFELDGDFDIRPARNRSLVRAACGMALVHAAFAALVVFASNYLLTNAAKLRDPAPYVAAAVSQLDELWNNLNKPTNSSRAGTPPPAEPFKPVVDPNNEQRSSDQTDNKSSASWLEALIKRLDQRATLSAVRQIADRINLYFGTQPDEKSPPSRFETLVRRLDQRATLSAARQIAGRINLYFGARQTGIGSGLLTPGHDHDRQDAYFLIHRLCEILATEQYPKDQLSVELQNLLKDPAAARTKTVGWEDWRSWSNCDPDSIEGVPSISSTSSSSAPNGFNGAVRVAGVLRNLSDARQITRDLLLSESSDWWELRGSAATRYALASALTLGSAAFLLAFLFSVGVFIGKRQEIDEFFGSLSSANCRKLVSRLEVAGWLSAPDGDVTDTSRTQALSAALAKRRASLNGLSIQECLMSTGSYLKLLDELENAEPAMENTVEANSIGPLTGS